MAETTQAPDPAHPLPSGNEAADEALCRDALNLLLRVGTTLARQIEAAATRAPDALPAPGTPPPPTLPETAAAFERVARAVRRTVLLVRTLADRRADREEQRSRDRAARAATRRRLIRGVENTIDRFAAPAAAEPMRAEFADRLDLPELDDDIADRPLADLVKEICSDLGVPDLLGTRPFPRRPPAALRDLAARAAAPARPPPNPAPGTPAHPAPWPSPPQGLYPAPMRPPPDGPPIPCP